MSIAEKLTTIAENQQAVYIAGKQAEYDRLVDPTKIIEQSVSGSVIRVDDVSEIPHKCTVSVDKDTTVTVCGKNLLDVSQLVIGNISGTTGADSLSETRLRTGYCSVYPGQLYVISGNSEPLSAIYCYDSDKNFIGTSAPNKNLPSNARYVRIVLGVSSTAFTEEDLTNVKSEPIQLELGSTATAYEPYREPSEYTITAGQAIEVDSICPTMTLLADNDATITFGYHKSWGMQTEYDRFWDAYQQNGNKTNYDQAFAFTHWTDETYNPKYDIVCNGSNSTRQAFYNGRMTSTKVPIRVKNTELNATFTGSSVKTIPLLELDGITGIRNNPFSGCSALENITIAGSIDWSVSFYQSPLLMQASVQSIIDHLKDLTGQAAQTLTFHADVGAKLTDEQKAAITAKNWTLVY